MCSVLPVRYRRWKLIFWRRLRPRAWGHGSRRPCPGRGQKGWNSRTWAWCSSIGQRHQVFATHLKSWQFSWFKNKWTKKPRHQQHQQLCASHLQWMTWIRLAQDVHCKAPQEAWGLEGALWQGRSAVWPSNKETLLQESFEPLLADQKNYNS